MSRRAQAAAALCAIALALLVVALWTSRSAVERLPEDVRIGGVDVGGLPVPLARNALERHARRLQARPVVVSSPGAPGVHVRLDPRRLGARPRIDEALARARGTRSLRDRLLGAVGVDRPLRLPLEFAFDAARLDAALVRAEDALGRRPTPATVRVVGAALRVQPGRPGLGVDDEALRREVSTLPSRIRLPRIPLEPPVSEGDAHAARAEAQRLLDRPPVVVGSSGRLTLEPPLLRAALRFTPVARRLVVQLDADVLRRALRSAYGPLERPVRQAALVPVGRSVRVVPEREGLRIDAQAVAVAAVQSPGRDVPLVLESVPPARTAAELRALNVDAVVADVSTPYACCEARVTNIRRAAAILDGTVLRPGETFRMNAAVGERTEARGFVAAPQIADGRFVEGVGGGVSQVATTLYNAAFFAGLELIAHTPHEVYLSRYPEGREATVSWGGPDLVFRNDWDAPVVIDLEAGDTSLRVRMYSRALGRRVETESDPRTEVEEPEVRRLFDPDLPPGAEVVDQGAGSPGFTVSYTRRVYRGAERTRDERYTWHYRPVDAIVRVGPAPPPPETTAPETTPPATTPDAPPAPTAPPPAPAEAPR